MSEISIHKYKSTIIIDVLEQRKGYFPFRFGMDDVLYCSGGEGTKIAIIGTGTPSHKDIIPSNILEISMDNEDLTDKHGFTTMISGILVANSNTGLQGFSPMAEIFSIKAINDKGIMDSRSLAASILWAVVKESDIIITPSLGEDYDYNVGNAIKKAKDLNIPVISFCPQKIDKTSIIYSEAFFLKPPFKKQSSKNNLYRYSKNVFIIKISKEASYTTFLKNKYVSPPTYIEGLATITGLFALLLPTIKKNGQRPKPETVFEQLVSLSK